ncbi:MAG: TonB family protein [Nevskiaceae bacterium]
MRKFLLSTSLALIVLATQAADTLNLSAETQAALADAEALTSACKYDEADAGLRKRLTAARVEDRGVLHVMIGQIAEYRGKPADALAQYRAAASSTPTPAQAYRLLGRAQIAGKQFEPGYKLLLAFVTNELKVAKRNPESLDMAVLAVAAAETGRLQEAQELLRLVTQRFPSYDPLVVDLRTRIDGALEGRRPATRGAFWTLVYGGAEAVRLASAQLEPIPVKTIAPNYPPFSQQRGVQGYAAVRVKVGVSGNVTDASVVEASPSNDFGAAAQDAVLKWKFAPAMRHCQAVPAETVQRIDFKIEGG